MTDLAQYAVRGYEVDALGFLVKPATYAGLSMNLDRAMREVARGTSRTLSIPTEDGFRSLPLSDVTHIEVRNHDLVYHATSGEKACCRKTLSQAEAELAGAGLGVAWRGIAGYSLAGLFALWSTWQTDAFLRVASASGSLWYEGWLGFAQGQEPAAWPERAYLSLGSKEHKTPNRLMRNVRTATEQTRDLLCSHGVECTFELNPGNHFQDPDLRMARGIRWILD